MGFFASILAFISLLLSLMHSIRLRFWSWNVRMVTYVLKMIAETFAPLIAVIAALTALIGTMLKDPLLAVMGALAAWLSARFIQRVATPHDGLKNAFGPEWERTLEKKTTPDQRKNMLRKRWSWKIMDLPQPVFQQDLPYWTIPGTGRSLLCDVWMPAGSVRRSRVGIIYLHPGGWESLDKDSHTRPLFRHLAAQGHTVMDVSYRLCFETDMAGIVSDVKHAIAWLKRNAARFQIDADRIILFGASAGGQLALLCAYTPNHPHLDPADLDGADTSVHAVISYYGLPDLRLLGLAPESPSIPALEEAGRRLGYIEPEGYLETPDLARRLFGGLPNEVPEIAALFSPIVHAGEKSPPTLQMIGTHDHIVNIEDIRSLDRILCRAGRVSVCIELPQVDHAFDLLALDVSPSAQSALYDTERFIALVS